MHIFAITRKTLLRTAFALTLLAVLWLTFNQLLPARRVDGEQAVKVPIIMYHSVLKDPAHSGKYVLTPDLLEQDMVYLEQHGYTTIVMEDLLNYVAGSTDLPPKPVMLTFDDGCYNNLLYVLPLLQKHEMRAVVSVVGCYADKESKVDEYSKQNANYSSLTWEEISTLHDSGLVEIQNHSYNMHNEKGRLGSKRKKGENADAYKKYFCEDVSTLQTLLERHCDISPTTFTYPYGAITDITREYLQEMGFHASLSCYERDNYLTRNPDELWELGRYNRPSGISSAQFLEKVL